MSEFVILCDPECVKDFHKDDDLTHRIEYGCDDEKTVLENMRLKSRYKLKSGQVRLKFITSHRRLK